MATTATATAMSWVLSPLLSLNDKIFECTEATFCPSRNVPEELNVENDVIDYVFESVESFTCRPEDDGDYAKNNFVVKAPRGDHQDLANFIHPLTKRDNSLIDEDPNCKPQPLLLERTKRNAKNEASDLLDYCFQQVESYTCNDGIDEHEIFSKPPVHVEMARHPSSLRRKKQNNNSSVGKVVEKRKAETTTINDEEDDILVFDNIVYSRSMVENNFQQHKDSLHNNNDKGGSFTKKRNKNVGRYIDECKIGIV